MGGGRVNKPYWEFDTTGIYGAESAWFYVNTCDGIGYTTRDANDIKIVGSRRTKLYKKFARLYPPIESDDQVLFVNLFNTAPRTAPPSKHLERVWLLIILGLKSGPWPPRGEVKPDDTTT